MSGVNKLGYCYGSGVHCGSSCLRDVYKHLAKVSFNTDSSSDSPWQSVAAPNLDQLGVVMTEAMAFGIGGGAVTSSFPLGAPGKYFFSGRCPDVVENFLWATGLPYTRHEAESEAEVLAGYKRVLNKSGDAPPAAIPPLPIITFGDTFYLPHFKENYQTSHFPGHIFTVVGINDKEVLAAERTDVSALKRITTEDFLHAIDPPDYPMTSLKAWIEFKSQNGGVVPRYSLLQSCYRGLFHQSAQMLGKPSPFGYNSALKVPKGLGGDTNSGEVVTIGSHGLVVMDQLAVAMATWKQERRVSAAVKRARVLFEILERRGTGGGNFRFLFAKFLKELQLLVARLAQVPEDRQSAMWLHRAHTIALQAAEQWVLLDKLAQSLSSNPDSNASIWDSMITTVKNCKGIEQELFQLIFTQCEKLPTTADRLEDPVTLDQVLLQVFGLTRHKAKSRL